MPKWWSDDNWACEKRAIITVRNNLPIITCSPWKPVATKKVAPYTESAIEKEASRYSIAWRAVK